MARLPASVSVSGSALTAATPVTILQLVAPANQRVAVTRLLLGLHSTSNADEPVQVELLRQTSAGTSSAATPVSRDGLGAETIQTTARYACTAEPTAGAVVTRLALHPQAAAVIDLDHLIPGGGRLGLRLTAAEDQTVDATFEFEE